MSQVDAARKLGYDASLVGRVERGERVVTPDYLACVIQAYDLDFAQSNILINRWLEERGLRPKRGDDATLREMYGID